VSVEVTRGARRGWALKVLAQKVPHSPGHKVCDTARYVELRGPEAVCVRIIQAAPETYRQQSLFWVARNSQSLELLLCGYGAYVGGGDECSDVADLGGQRLGVSRGLG
jgi:hypothetical protein